MKMDELNWSEKDYKRIAEASLKSYEFFLNYGGKKSEEVIRDWRDRNWQS